MLFYFVLYDLAKSAGSHPNKFDIAADFSRSEGQVVEPRDLGSRHLVGAPPTTPTNFWGTVIPDWKQRFSDATLRRSDAQTLSRSVLPRGVTATCLALTEEIGRASRPAATNF